MQLLRSGSKTALFNLYFLNLRGRGLCLVMSRSLQVQRYRFGIGIFGIGIGSTTPVFLDLLLRLSAMQVSSLAMAARTKKSGKSSNADGRNYIFMLADLELLCRL